MMWLVATTRRASIQGRRGPSVRVVAYPLWDQAFAALVVGAVEDLRRRGELAPGVLEGRLRPAHPAAVVQAPALPGGGPGSVWYAYRDGDPLTRAS
jgi:hypothetical protein